MKPPHTVWERTCPLLPPETDLKPVRLKGHQTGTGPAPYALKFRLPLQNARSPLKKRWRRLLSLGQVSAPTVERG